MRVSIIVINHNYGRFLRQAIQSCLDQTYDNLETIVVDDGSTDDSQEVIGEFGTRIVSVFQENSGMMEAANTGFCLATGEVIIFLDADDYLLDCCIERIADNWKQGISKVHYRLRQIDHEGSEIGVFPPPEKRLGEGEVWKEILRAGVYITPPTSGNAFAREVLGQIFPVRDARIGEGDSYYDVLPTDAYLKLRVPFYGPVVAIDDVLGVYRIHGTNAGADKNPYFHREKRQRLLRLAKKNCEFIKERTAALEVPWEEEMLFGYGRTLKLRVLSFRFDGRHHPWPADTKSGLMKTAWSNVTRVMFKEKGRKIYDLVVVGLLCAVPYPLARLLLKVIH